MARRAQLAHIGMPIVCRKTRPPITNMLSIKNSSILMISVSENFLVESVFFDKVRFVPSLDKVFVSTLAILFNVKDIY